MVLVKNTDEELAKGRIMQIHCKTIRIIKQQQRKRLHESTYRLLCDSFVWAFDGLLVKD